MSDLATPMAECPCEDCVRLRAKNKPKSFATVNIEEAEETLIYVRIDPEVVKRIENIERMLKYIYDRDFGT